MKIAFAHPPMSSQASNILPFKVGQVPHAACVGLVTSRRGAVLIDNYLLVRDAAGAEHGLECVLGAADGEIEAEEVIGVEIRNSVGRLDVVQPSSPERVAGGGRNRNGWSSNGKRRKLRPSVYVLAYNTSASQLQYNILEAIVHARPGVEVLLVIGIPEKSRVRFVPEIKLQSGLHIVVLDKGNDLRQEVIQGGPAAAIAGVLEG